MEIFSKLSLTGFLLHHLLLVFFNPAFASADADVDFILSAKNPPTGIIFEVVESGEKDLEFALKKIAEYSEKLKSKIPSIKLAVVSHGTEQFALLKENQKRYKNTHQKVRLLTSDDVPVSICGTHASWYSFSKDDFPEYVDVAETGPKKIREYQRLGYALIKIEL